MKTILLAVLLSAAACGQTPDPQLAAAQKTLADWPNLKRYQADNAKLSAPTRVVFMGDSITDNWGRRYGKFFPTEQGYVNRGIGGQTTPQMLLRFRQDVIALHPKVVVILAGTNDIAGNTGPATIKMVEDNLTSMAELAQANGIRVIFSAVMPVCDYIRPQTEKRPPAKIIELNQWIATYAASAGHTYLDYYTPMLDEKQMLKKELTYDGLHPNDEGYALIEPIAAKIVKKVLGDR